MLFNTFRPFVQLKFGSFTYSARTGNNGHFYSYLLLLHYYTTAVGYVLVDSTMSLFCALHGLQRRCYQSFTTNHLQARALHYYFLSILLIFPLRRLSFPKVFFENIYQRDKSL